MTPSAWIQKFTHLVPKDSPVLDIACGSGRHSLHFAEQGHPVTAVDINTSKIPVHPLITPLQKNLETEDLWIPPKSYFGCVVVVNYLYKPLFPSLISALKSDGVLLYETFCSGQEQLGRPKNPEFLLQPNELLNICIQQFDLSVVAYECGHIQGAIKQRICAAQTNTHPLPVFDNRQI